MGRWIGVVPAAAAALMLAGALGVAGAQAPPAVPAAQRLVTVNGGSASEVASDASEAVRRAAYRTALGAALDDAKAKASFVAERSGLVLGAVQSVTEQTGSVLDGCVVLATSQGSAETRPLPPLRRPKKRRASRPRPRSAQAAQPVPPGAFRCQVVASVTVSYTVVS